MKTEQMNKKHTLTRIVSFIAVLCCIVSLSMSAAAEGETNPQGFVGELGNSTFFTGAKQMIADITLVLTILCPSICIVLVIWFLIRRAMADEQEGKIWTKRIVVAIAVGVGGTLASALISLVTSYFG